MNLDLIGAVISLWKGFNGGKFNTGAAAVLLTFGFQKFLSPTLGLDHNQTTSMVSTLIQGVGYVLVIIGGLHKIWKAWRAKKAAGAK
jgi:hypothetical protein